MNTLITAVEAPFCEKFLRIALEALDISINIYTELSLFVTIMIPMALYWITKWNMIGVLFLCCN